MAIDVNKIFIALWVGFSNTGTSFVACKSANGMNKTEKIERKSRGNELSALGSSLLAGNCMTNRAGWKAEQRLELRRHLRLRFYSENRNPW